jgi:hypothetical protein
MAEQRLGVAQLVAGRLADGHLQGKALGRERRDFRLNRSGERGRDSDRGRRLVRRRLVERRIRHNLPIYPHQWG